MSSPPRTTLLPPLDDHHTAKLVQHIERAGGLANTTLKQLCDDHPDDLGGPGSDLRRQCQKKHDKFKNKWTAVKYLAFVKNHKISPSIATERAAFLETQAMAEKEEDNEGTTNDGTTNDGTSFTNEGSGDAEDLADDFANLHVEEEEELTTPPRILRNTPTRGSASRGSASRGSASRGNRTPPPAAVPPLLPRSGNGTKNNPFVIVYDISFPERHFPFIIKYQQSITCDGFEHQCFDIEKTGDPLDMDAWEASLPFPPICGFEKRIVDVKGPSIPFQFRHQDETLTDTEHKAFLLDLQDQPSRNSLYWRIVFPVNFLLNNDIFSKGRKVFADHKPLTIKKNHDENDYEKDFHAVLLHWRIAIDGGTRPTATQTKTDKKNFFK